MSPGLILLLCLAPIPVVARYAFVTIWNAHRNCTKGTRYYGSDWSCGKWHGDLWDIHKRWPVALLAFLLAVVYPLSASIWLFARPTRTERLDLAERSLLEREAAIAARQVEIEKLERRLERM
jgi:hypothetical protein